MALTQIQAGSIEPGAINTTDLGANVTATYATYAAVAANLTPRITTVNVANSSYTVLDDTSVNTSGGYLVITGANFQSGAIVTVQDTNATSTTYVNDTTLRAQVPAKTAGSYNLYVTNPDGGTAIKVLGVSYSNTPIWGTAATLSNQAANTAFAVNISANSDSNVTYSNTTSLPAGTTLLANGLFYGTVTIGAETTYTFTISAIDAELQDTPREFSLTVTVTPTYFMYTWGINHLGQLALNTGGVGTYVSSPTQVGSSKWLYASISNTHGVAIKEGNSLWSWGYNNSGELGQNDSITKSSPVQVGSSTNWSKLFAGPVCTFLIKNDQTLWAIGEGSGGKLGLNSTASISSPTQVGTNTNWSTISAGATGSVLAIKTDGTLWAWGDPTEGKLGLNNVTVSKSSPTQVGSSTNWSKVSIDYYHALAVKTDGTLWTWGYSAGHGNLGINVATAYRSSPIQIGSSTDWSTVDTGYLTSMAIKTDGTLWGWGFNNSGWLGHNNVSSKSSPTQVGSGTTWSAFSLSGNGGFGHTLAIKTDGTLWGWGRNDKGQVGVGDSLNKSSPVQIGTNTGWALVNNFMYSSIALRS